VGRGGAPEIPDGVLPAENVAVTGSVVPDAMPDEMDCRGGKPGGAVGRLVEIAAGGALDDPEVDADWVAWEADEELVTEEDARDDTEELDDADDEAEAWRACMFRATL
jgi:hypothetical protein